LSAAFNRFKIPNESFRLSVDQLVELGSPFIAYWKGDFVTVMHISPEVIKYKGSTEKSLSLSLDEFRKDYGGIVFAAEPNEASGEEDYDKSVQMEKSLVKKKLLLSIGIGLAVILLLCLSVYNTLSGEWIPTTALIIFAKLLGLGTTVFLLAHETDRGNAFTKNICAAGKNINCDAVLSSKGSRIMGVSWSEIGFFYFAATSAILFSTTFSITSKLTILAPISTLASIYTLFSLYYQWKVVKQWCPLCLVVQSALVLELLWSITAYWLSNVTVTLPGTYAILYSITSLLVPVVLWYLIKPTLAKSIKHGKLETAYRRLLYNPEMFNALLQQQPAAPAGWDEIEITIGNDVAKKSIIKVCNPYCGPCAKAHPILEEIISRNPEYNLKIIFTSTNDPNDPGGQVARHLLAIAETASAEKAKEAIDAWYLATKKDYSSFATKYPMNSQLAYQEEKLEQMNKWCKTASISFTPTIFIDGRKLPETYGVAELRNILV